jgi:hypothetical protein
VLRSTTMLLVGEREGEREEERERERERERETERERESEREREKLTDLAVKEVLSNSAPVHHYVTSR